MDELDQQIRLKAFQWLEKQVALYGDVLPRALLREGFRFGDERVPLVSPQGIFKPRLLDLPLSITTAPRGPYDDSFGEDGFLRYKYRGTDPGHRDNAGLREALIRGTPLVYFHGVVPGKYMAVWPVYIIEDHPETLTFKVAVDDMAGISMNTGAHVHEAVEGRRAYITATVRRRLHQRSFRERVLHAYREQCALCRLRHHELLDAAHIIPDADPKGLPSVTNGIALCKLHHAAFDRYLLGITPDYRVDVRTDILEEEDGPMLQHGLKELHRQKIILPRRKELWPVRELLDVRYQQFRAR
ncbi:HNH endonuclease [Rhodocaloribacter sp.]